MHNSKEVQSEVDKLELEMTTFQSGQNSDQGGAIDTENQHETDEEQAENLKDEPIGNDSNLGNYHLAKDRGRKVIRPPNRFKYTVLVAYALQVKEDLNDEPKTYHEAMNGRDKLQWKKAIDEEFNSLLKNET